MRVIPAKTATVFRNRSTAFFLCPSKSSKTGLYKNRYPMTAADSVKSERTAIGVRNVSLGPKTVFALYITVATHTMYSEAHKALINGFLVIEVIIAFESISPPALPKKIVC